jgi:hypothetical protein
MLVSSSLAVEISKLPPFETSTPPSLRFHAPAKALPWLHSSIISSIAASVSQPPHATNPADVPDHHPIHHAPLPSNGADSPAAAPARDEDEQEHVKQGCIPPAVRNKCSIL